MIAVCPSPIRLSKILAAASCQVDLCFPLLNLHPTTATRGAIGIIILVLLYPLPLL